MKNRTRRICYTTTCTLKRSNRVIQTLCVVECEVHYSGVIKHFRLVGQCFVFSGNYAVQRFVFRKRLCRFLKLLHAPFLNSSVQLTSQHSNKLIKQTPFDIALRPNRVHFWRVTSQISVESQLPLVLVITLIIVKWARYCLINEFTFIRIGYQYNKQKQYLVEKPLFKCYRLQWKMLLLEKHTFINGNVKKN